jgi:predicted nucleic acid-binding protein
MFSDRRHQKNDVCATRMGTRALDILHVASALLLRAERILTFDDRQRQLAHAEGLATR